MIRTQVQLTEQQQAKLRKIAARRGVSVAQLVREGIDTVLAAAETDERWERLRKAIGAFRDPQGRTDVAESHDDYLEETLSRDHGLR